jgi:ferredoxin-NADP reductase
MVLHSSLSSILGVLFILIAGTNVATALMTFGRVQDRAASAWLIRAHRFGGYLFIALYCAMSYFMTLRLKGVTEEFSPRVEAHIILALLLAPLLLVKIFIVRYRRQHFSALLPLGLAIFAGSFVLVAMNLLPHWLGRAAHGRVPAVFSVAVLITILSATSALFLRRGARSTSGHEGPAADSKRPHFDHPPDATKLLRLARIEPQTPDARTLRFVIRDQDRFKARPGQFLTFRWNIDGRVVERSYSICSSPSQTAYVEITPKRVENGDVSVFLNERAAVGLVVEARGPFGQFCFDEAKHNRILLIAGGSGITPMISMLRHIDDCCLATDVTLIFCVRRREDVLFKQELDRLKTRLENFRLVLILSRPDAESSGARGHISRELIAANAPKLDKTDVFLCGPPAFSQTALEILSSLGADPGRIHRESFVVKPPPTAVANLPHTSGTTIEFVRSARQCAYSPGESLLEVAERNGIRIPFSCRQGQCGTCVTRLLEGEVTMDCEEGLGTTQKADGDILMCVGRAKGNIRLDA